MKRPTCPWPSIRPALLLLLACLGAPPASATAQDRIVLATGIELGGEIQEARRGELSFDSDDLGDVTVDLADLVEISSPRFFEVTDANGILYMGSLAAGDSGTVVVADGGPSSTLNIADVVELQSFESTLLGRTNGHVDVGANVAAANSLASLLIGGRFAYRGPRWGTRHGVDAYWQRQTTTGELGGELEQTTSRVAVASSVSRYWARWAIQASAGWERNQELGLRSRLQLGLQGLYSLARNRSAELTAGLGGANNREDYEDTDPTTSAEIVAAAILDLFDVGDVDVYTGLYSYANLSDAGRFRLKLDGRVSWEFVDDFTIGFTVLEQLDNRPPSASARKRDFQYGLTVGWSWS